MVQCIDNVPDLCADWLEGDASLCQSFYGREYCQKSCDLCGTQELPAIILDDDAGIQEEIETSDGATEERAEEEDEEENREENVETGVENWEDFAEESKEEGYEEPDQFYFGKVFYSVAFTACLTYIPEE